MRLLTEFLRRAKEDNRLVSVLVIDIDDFRKVNDGLGIVAGPFAARSFIGLGGPAQLDHAQESHTTVSGVSGTNVNTVVPAYPNGPNNGLILSRKLLVERGVALRGVSRGLLLAASATTPDEAREILSLKGGDMVVGCKGRKFHI